MSVRYLRVLTITTLAVCLVALPVPGWGQAPQPQPPAPPAPQQPTSQRVKAIEIRGSNHVPAERILAAVTETKVGDPVSDEKIRADVRGINELGLFADVTARMESEPDGIHVIFLVTENPVVAEIVVEGSSVISADEIRKALGVPVGEVLNLNRMRDGTRAVQKLYEDKGYVLARVADIGIIPTEGPPDQGRLRVRIAEGTVEAVRFDGLKKTRLVTVRRQIQDTKAGGVFSVDKLNRDLQRLFDTGLFEAIRARPEPGTAPDSAVVVIEVTEARTAQIGGGLGYSSRDGLLGFVEFRDRNWRGFGQTFALRAERSVQTGTRRFNYEVSFTDPYLDAMRTTIDLSLYSRSSVDQEYSGATVVSRFELQRTGALISLTRPLDKVTTAAVRFRSELTEITPLPVDPNNPGSPVVTPSASLLTPGRVVSLQLSATRDTRNDRFKPTAGEKITLSSEFGLRALGGDFGFTKYLAEYQHLFPVGRQSVIVGRLFAGAATGTLPSQEQFLLGGSSTVRALQIARYRSNSMIVANVEYRFPLGTLIKQLGEIQGILFVDAGSAPLQFNDLKAGYGVGVAVNTPIGPIRIDFAFGPEGQQTWLSLGAPF